MQFQRAILFAPLFTAAVACGSSAPSNSPSSTDVEAAPNGVATAAPSEPLFGETIVHLNSDGPPTVIEKQVSGAELAAQRAAFQARAQARAEGRPLPLTPDIAEETCSDATLWLSNTTNCSGYTICFSGEGTANLADYSYCTFDCIFRYQWAGNVASWQAETETGYLTYTYGDNQYEQDFGPYGSCTNADTYETDITSVTLTD